MKSKFWIRLVVCAGLLWRLMADLFKKRRAPQNPQKILILHTLLLGDSVMLISLFKTLRQRFPSAEIFLALPPAFLELFQTNPYNICCLPFDPKNLKTFWQLQKHAPFDLGLLPAENRYSWHCRVLQCAWIIGFENDKKPWHNFFVDEKVAYPKTPAAFVDFCTLLCPAPIPKVRFENEWQKTHGTLHNLPPLPKKPFAVLHLGASSPTRFWNPQHWQNVAKTLTKNGFSIVFTGTKNEIPLIKEVDPDAHYLSLAGQSSLLQLKEVLENAAVVVSPDTGIAHLVKITGTPSVALFGPGSPEIYGSGDFFNNQPCRIVDANPPCRTGKLLFERRHVPWVRHCAVAFKDCPTPHFCMAKITPADVINAIFSFFPRSTEQNFEK